MNVSSKKWSAYFIINLKAWTIGKWNWIWHRVNPSGPVGSSCSLCSGLWCRTRGAVSAALTSVPFVGKWFSGSLLFHGSAVEWLWRLIVRPGKNLEANLKNRLLGVEAWEGLSLAVRFCAFLSASPACQSALKPLLSFPSFMQLSQRYLQAKPQQTHYRVLNREIPFSSFCSLSAWLMATCPQITHG